MVNFPVPQPQRCHVSRLWLFCTLCAFGLSLTATSVNAQDGDYYANEIFLVNDKEEGPDLPPVTDPSEVLDRDLTVHTSFFPLNRPKGAKLYAYANGEGRVRVLLDTDLSRDIDLFGPQFVYDGEESFPYFETNLLWKRTFTKGSDDSKTTATILPSFLRFYAPSVPPGVPTSTDFGQDRGKVPWAQWLIRIYVDRNLDGVENQLPSLGQVVQISGVTSNANGPRSAKFGFSGQLGSKKIGEGGPIPYRSYFSSEGELLPEGFVPIDTFRYEIASNYTHELDLSHIPTGEQYTVSYFLSVSGGTYDDDFVWAYIADPLDPENADSGVQLVTTDLPANVDLGRQCDELFNDHRYANNQDGTATDRYTGLMWQRCPVNQTLEDQGTPDDLADDVCVLDAGAEVSADWQGALSLSIDDVSAGHDDWRVPNVKELETLVANCSSPTIEPELFPGTPAHSGFWSNTSGRFVWQQFINPADIAVDAWQVEFANGDLQTTDKTALAYTRLVRDTGDLPIAPLPAISAGRAAIDEGDTGSSVMAIPVALSKVATTEVTVDYAVTAPNNNAINGMDFDETAGTLVFLPGETAKKIPVTVYGNIDATNNKILDLNLSNSSQNSRIAIPIGIGTIIDDDPVISLGGHTVQAYEGNSTLTQSQIRVPVFLDRPAAQPIAVDYELLQGTAEFGTDVSGFVNGTVTIQTGSKVSYIDINPVNDDVLENDETLTVEISNPVGAKLAPGSGDTLQQLVVLVNDDNAGTYTALNDTGLTTCATEADNAQGCPQTGLPLQDAEQGRDADPATNDPADGDVGFSFTKLDNAGVGLPSSASSWSCLNDNVTGLIWETKTANISSPIENNDLHSSRWTYSWYNSTGINDGGYAGVQNGGVCIDTINCDTEKFVAAVNAEALCGYTDWRLPTIDELYTIVDMTGDFSAQIKYARGASGTTRYFPYPQLDVSSGPWSSSTAAGRDNGINAWYLAENGMTKKDKGELRTTPLPVRLVRGGIIAP